MYCVIIFSEKYGYFCEENDMFTLTCQNKKELEVHKVYSLEKIPNNACIYETKEAAKQAFEKWGSLYWNSWLKSKAVIYREVNAVMCNYVDHYEVVN